MIVLLPNAGFLSETSRMLHVARALQAQGEAVAIATHGGPYLSVLDEAGMPYTLLEPVMDGQRQFDYLRDLCRIGKPGVRLQSADEVRRSVQSEVAFLREQRARMVVIGFTLTAYLSARVAGIPLAASHGGSYIPPVFERGMAPVPTTMPIPGTEWLPDWLKRQMANRMPSRMRGPTAFLNEIAAELGVEGVPTLAALMLGDLTLVTDTASILGIPESALRAWRPSPAHAYRAGTELAYVGPLFARLERPVPEPVSAFLDGRQPTAYVALSSSSPQMLREVTARVRAAGLRVIVAATIHEVGIDPDPQVIVGGILPSHRIMPSVDVVVSMGGQGTVQTAMSCGTPLVAIPLHPEQEMNVELAARQGMALAIAPRHAGTTRMTDAVRQVVADGAYKAAARKVQSLYAGIDAAGNAATEIRRYLSERASSGLTGEVRSAA